MHVVGDHEARGSPSPEALLEALAQAERERGEGLGGASQDLNDSIVTDDDLLAMEMGPEGPPGPSQDSQSPPGPSRPARGPGPGPGPAATSGAPGDRDEGMRVVLSLRSGLGEAPPAPSQDGPGGGGAAPAGPGPPAILVDAAEWEEISRATEPRGPPPPGAAGPPPGSPGGSSRSMSGLSDGAGGGGPRTPPGGAPPALPDVEDLGGGVADWTARALYLGMAAVTKLTAYCERQVVIQMQLSLRPPPTPAMERGVALHEALEREVLGPRVPLPTATTEDRVAAELAEAVANLRVLLREGRTREVGLWACVRGHWLSGKMDELRVVRERGRPRLVVSDTKVKSGCRLPGQREMTAHEMQVVTYREMLATATRDAGAWARGLLARLSELPADGRTGPVDVDGPLSPGVAEAVAEAAGLGPAGPAPTVRGCVASLASHLDLLPPLSGALAGEVEYRSADEGGAVLGTNVIELTDGLLDEHGRWLERATGYLEGRRAPGEGDEWVCRNCWYRDVCPVGRERGGQSPLGRAELARQVRRLRGEPSAAPSPEGSPRPPARGSPGAASPRGGL